MHISIETKEKFEFLITKKCNPNVDGSDLQSPSELINLHRIGRDQFLLSSNRLESARRNANPTHYLTNIKPHRAVISSSHVCFVAHELVRIERQAVMQIN